MSKPLDKLTPKEVAFYRERKERIEAANVVIAPTHPVTIGSN